MDEEVVMSGEVQEFEVRSEPHSPQVSEPNEEQVISKCEEEDQDSGEPQSEQDSGEPHSDPESGEPHSEQGSPMSTEAVEEDNVEMFPVKQEQEEEEQKVEDDSTSHPDVDTEILLKDEVSSEVIIEENVLMETEMVIESENGTVTEKEVSEMVIKDELPAETVSEEELSEHSAEALKDEVVSDEELLNSSSAVDLPETEAVSEDGVDSNSEVEIPSGMVTVDELPAEMEEEELTSETVKEPLETEAVSDEEFPDPTAAVDLPETEAVSEDELPPEKTDKKKDGTTGGSAESTVATTVRKKKQSKSSIKKSEAQKRKLGDGDTYDPNSPTSENSGDESPRLKRAAVAASGSSTKVKSVVIVRKALSELDKYWKAVKEDPTDFTGWTYLLQYVDQENDIEAAREAYDAFLSHYPYCYGYWRKYADYEKRKGFKEKCEEVFEQGLKAIPLSVDLWIHYLNYCKAVFSDDEDTLRNQFEKGITACGLDFRSDRLWDTYIKWEIERKKLQNVTSLYDRLLQIPTQGYTNHFDSFQEHISNNPPQKVLSVDEFLTLRREVLQLLKQYEQPLSLDDGVPGEEADVPPGEESEEQPTVKTDEETTALRERVISLRRKVHKNTVSLVADRWAFEEAIKRPYFHVKPLERSQLKNWKEYLDYEIEQGDQARVIVLFERCLIACALYEEFWIKFIRYLESLNEDVTDKIRNVYERACTIHHTKKPNLHLHWAAFEESYQNYEKASLILSNLEQVFPNMLQIAYRRINLERRWKDLDKVCALYEHYINISKNKVVANNMAIKYARFCWKIMGDVEKAIGVLNKAIEKDKENPRLYLQLIDMGLQKSPVSETEIVTVIDEFLGGDSDLEQKVLFAQRKVEFLEDFGSDILNVQKAHDEFQKFFKMAKDRKKRSSDFDIKLNSDGSQSKKQKVGQVSSADAQHTPSHSSSQSPHGASGQVASQSSTAQPTTTASGTGPYPPPSYTQNGGYSQQTTAQGSYQSGQYPTTGGQQPPTPYSQTPYNQQYSQSDPNYPNYQGWGYSQTGYGGYNQGWGNYNYY